MEATQNSKFGMLRKEETFLNSIDPAFFNSMPGFLNKYGEYKDKILEIRALRNVQSRDRKGLARDKADFRELLYPLGLGTAAKIASFATNTGNNVLNSEMNFNLSELKGQSAEEFYTTNEFILQRANEHAPALVIYGVTAAMLTDYAATLDQYNVAIPMPKVGVEDRKVATEDLKEAFDQADEQLRVMDGMVRGIRFSEPDFYQRYFTARRIDGPGSRTLSAMGEVVDVDGNAIPFVMMTCETMNLKRRASRSGGFRYKDCSEGVHRVMYSRPGFVTTYVNMVIAEGVRFEVQVVMERHV